MIFHDLMILPDFTTFPDLAMLVECTIISCFRMFSGITIFFNQLLNCPKDRIFISESKKEQCKKIAFLQLLLFSH